MGIIKDARTGRGLIRIVKCVAKFVGSSMLGHFPPQCIGVQRKSQGIQCIILLIQIKLFLAYCALLCRCTCVLIASFPTRLSVSIAAIC